MCLTHMPGHTISICFWRVRTLSKPWRENYILQLKYGNHQRFSLGDDFRITHSRGSGHLNYMRHKSKRQIIHKAFHFSLRWAKTYWGYFWRPFEEHSAYRSLGEAFAHLTGLRSFVYGQCGNSSQGRRLRFRVSLLLASATTRPVVPADSSGGAHTAAGWWGISSPQEHAVSFHSGIHYSASLGLWDDST